MLSHQFFLLLLCFAFTNLAAGFEPRTEHTFKLSEGESPPTADLEDASWMAGSWQGSAFGKTFEEVWNPPSAGSMVGLFKLYDGDSVDFYELMTLSADDNGRLSLKVKHFSSDFTAWEDKADFVDFKLVAIDTNAIHFAGISFYRRDENHMDAYIVLRTGDVIKEEHLVYRRRTDPAGEPQFPVQPVLFIDEFDGSEGITFNDQGQLFIGANNAIYLVSPVGKTERLTEVYTHLGMARIGDRDILAADFGPTNVFRDGPNNDGIIWRVTPDGEKTAVAKGIADPNFILVLPDETYLVSDDGTDKIYQVTAQGEVTVWSQAVPYPNGLALSPDGSALYVAQIFKTLSLNKESPKIEFDDKLWRIPLTNFKPAGKAEVVAHTGGSGLDGLVVDRLGRIYIADNQVGRIIRYDPSTGKLTLIAEGMSNVASLVFGEGDFDHKSLYATTTARGSGKIWRIPVGISGAAYYR